MNHTENATQEATINTPDTQSLWTDVVNVNVALTSVQLYFTLLQLIAFIGGMVWANHYIKERDRRDEHEKREREKRDLKEQLEREERDKVAEILSSEYDKIESENIPEEIRKTKAVFENMIIYREEGGVDITGLNVLIYMCREENYQRCKTPLLENLHRNLDAVWKLFRSFRIKLPLKGVCPQSIREELGPLITDLGKMTASFLMGTKRATIWTVLKYFGQPLTPDEYEEKNLDVIPYINELRYKEDAQSVKTLTCLYEDTTKHGRTDLAIDGHTRTLIDTLTTLSHILQTGKEIEGFSDLLEDIQSVWQRNPSPFPQPLPRVDLSLQDKKALRANMLHAVRILLHRSHNAQRGDINCECFQNLTARLTQIHTKTMNQITCERTIQDIKLQLWHLSDSYPRLLQEQTTVAVLVGLDKDFGNFMKERLKNCTPQNYRQNAHSVAGIDSEALFV